MYAIRSYYAIRKKVMRAVTDAGPTEPNSPKPEPIQNLFTLMDIMTDPAIVQQFDAAYKDCSIRYGDLKKQLAEDIVAFTAPIRERVNDILADEAYLANRITSYNVCYTKLLRLKIRRNLLPRLLQCHISDDRRTVAARYLQPPA